MESSQDRKQCDHVPKSLLDHVLPKLRPFQREAVEFATKGKNYNRQFAIDDKSRRCSTADNDGGGREENKVDEDPPPPGWMTAKCGGYGGRSEVTDKKERNPPPPGWMKARGGGGGSRSSDSNRKTSNGEAWHDDGSHAQELLGKGRIILGDEMGLGKSLTALTIMAVYEREWPLLILCPASLRYTWPQEIEKWFPSLSPASIYVVVGFHDIEFVKRRDIKVVIVTYSLIQERSAVVHAIVNDCKFKCIIADESHNLKERTSQRSKLILPVLTRARRLVLLSGTPALARPAELWTQLSCLAPRLFGKWIAYANRYCDPKKKRFGRGNFAMDYKGSSNLAELHAKLKTVMVRRLKCHVLQELPPKQRSIIPIMISKSEEAECLKAMKELKEKRVSVEGLIGREAEKADFEAKAKLMRAYQVGGIGKAEAVKDYLMDWLAGSEKQKILVFAHHKAVLDCIDKALLSKLPNSHIRIDGSVAPNLRTQMVSQFQNVDRVRVGLLSMTAAGVGLTMTAASTVLFGELHWTPGVLAQCEDRAHRIGQMHDSVQVIYMVCKDTRLSIDMDIWRMLGKKIQTLDQVVDGREEDTPYIFEARVSPSKEKPTYPHQGGKSVLAEVSEFFSEASAKESTKKPVKGTIQSFFQKATKTATKKARAKAYVRSESPGKSPSSESPGKSKMKTKPSSLNHLEWSCETCSYINSSTEVQQEWLPCEMCGNLYSNPVVVSAHKKPSDKLSARRTAGGVDRVEWICKSCETSNSMSRMTSGWWYPCSTCKEPYAAPDHSDDSEDDEVFDAPPIFTPKSKLSEPTSGKVPAASLHAHNPQKHTAKENRVSQDEEIVILDGETPQAKKAPNSRRSENVKVVCVDDSPPEKVPAKTSSGGTGTIINIADTPPLSSSQGRADVSKSDESTMKDQRHLPFDGKTASCAAATQSLDSVESRHGKGERTASSSIVFKFSVSKNSGRITIHRAHDGMSSMVNFGIDEVVSKDTSNRLLQATVRRPGAAAATSERIDFDDEAVTKLIDRVEGSRHDAVAHHGRRNSALSPSAEIKAFVRAYLMLREVEKKVLQESGEMCNVHEMSPVIARLLHRGNAGSDTSERYGGGAKERARGAKLNGTATARDIAILEGRGCAWCGNALPKASMIAGVVYCSQSCAEDGRLRRGGQYASKNIRAAMFALERGVCTLCKTDAHSLYERILVLEPAQRLNALLSANWRLPKAAKALENLLQDPKEGLFWQVDHIRAVSEGGGNCGLDNLRTLCVPCHTEVTERLRGRLPLTQHRDDGDNDDENKGNRNRPKRKQIDIRSAFAGASGKAETTAKRIRN